MLCSPLHFACILCYNIVIMENKIRVNKHLALKTLLYEQKDFGLTPIFFGFEQCVSNQKWGPYSRDYYLIHFCIKGQGTLNDKFGTHQIKEGQFFILRPNEVATYTADPINPWKYAWIAFNGQEASAFNSLNSVCNSPKGLGETLLDYAQREVYSSYAYKALLYNLMYQLNIQPQIEENTALKIKRYVDLNYMQQISVNTISDYFGFDRSYLYRIFKNYTGKSVKDYLTMVRLNKAKAFLQNGYSVSDTAFMVGYTDPFNFSKAFKKFFRKAPISEKKR